MKQDSIRIAADSQARFNNNTAFCIGTGRMGLALQQEYQQQLAMAQAEYKLAKENLASTDTLYRIGQQRHRIAAISQADLLTLKLDKEITHIGKVRLQIERTSGQVQILTDT